MVSEKHTFVERKKELLNESCLDLFIKKDRAQLLNLGDLFEPFKGT